VLHEVCMVCMVCIRLSPGLALPLLRTPIAGWSSHSCFRRWRRKSPSRFPQTRSMVVKNRLADSGPADRNRGAEYRGWACL